MLDSGLFPGSILLEILPTNPNAFWVPGIIEKSSISLFIKMPVPGMITFDPKDVLMVAVIATQFPLLSMQQR